MVAAEKWYEYEDNYRRYGLDMRAPQTRPTRTKAKPKKHVLIAKDRRRLLAYVIVLATVCIGMVISGAYAATLKCNINKLIASNAEIEKDIETLNVEIKTANNISTIEAKAIGELGMIYPSAAEIVYVTAQSEPATNFGVLLKEQAYQ